MDAGITIEPQTPGLVSDYECREAAVFVHVSWDHWLNTMTHRDRAFAVAHYRTHLLVEAHIHDAQERESERRRKRNSKPSTQD